jgi:protein gp37
MAQNSDIEWTDATWNPIRGCTRVSEGCRNCYAESIAARFSGPDKPFEGLAKFVTTPSGREARWTGKVKFIDDQLLAPLRWKKPKRIFVNSMSDLFHEGVERDHLDLIYHVMAAAHWHTFQVLTKRPKRLRDYLRDPETQKRQTVLGHEITDRLGGEGPHYVGACPTLVPVGFDPDDGHMINLAGDWSIWPLPNVWHGVSVENQSTADDRIPWLLDTPSAVRFLSCEPLLGPVDLTRLSPINHPQKGDPDPFTGRCYWPAARGAFQDSVNAQSDTTGKLHWVIVGGESGPDARPMHPSWARDLRDQCIDADVAFFFKQWGEWNAVYDRDREDPDWRRCDVVSKETPNGQWMNLAGGNGFHGDCVVRMDRVGKARAGRLLDGYEWLEFPTPVKARAA